MMLERGPDRVSPFAIPLSVANMGAGQVSIELGLRGPVTAVCTACAAGTDAIGTAADIIRRGDARAMLAGGGDCLISPFFVAGFDAMRVLSHRNDDPAGAARPFDRDRDGFLVGEAGAVVVLEPWDDAVARGAAHRLRGGRLRRERRRPPPHRPRPERRAPGARRDARRSQDAGIAPDRRGPRQRPRRRQQARRPGRGADAPARAGRGGAARVAVSATKSMHGHCMGATGALEAAITALALQEGDASRRRSTSTRSTRRASGVDHVANTARPADIRVALSASYGLGGHNAVLALTRADEDGRRMIERSCGACRRAPRRRSAWWSSCAVAAVARHPRRGRSTARRSGYTAVGDRARGHPGRPGGRAGCSRPKGGRSAALTSLG